MNIIFSFCEFYLGDSHNSLGIISDAIHIFLDSLSLIIGYISLRMKIS